ncbi:MAG: hypothetical protein JSS79_12550 [Bacteroidetes bacterium]|nr:hypothetical protein [Bacteroidota bacterium]
MKVVILFALLFFFQEEIPFKPADEFKVNVDLKFKEKPSAYNTSTFSGNGERLDTRRSGIIGFLKVSVTDLKINEDEVKVAIITSAGKYLMKKKTSPVPEIKFDMGFMDDLKSGVVPNEYTILFFSAEKKKVRKIVCKILPSGVFMVNGEWHGQF